MSRLALVDKQLSADLDGLNDLQRRQAIIDCCAFVLANTNIGDSRASSGLEALKAGLPRRGQRSELVRLVEELDGVAWDLQDAVEVGQARGDDYATAFRRARAAAALEAAFEADSRQAVDDVFYEAFHALEDPSPLKAILSSVSDGRWRRHGGPDDGSGTL